MGMKTKEKKRKGFHINRRNVLDFFSTVGIILVAYGTSTLLVKLSSSSANVAAVFTLAVLLVARMTEGYGWGILASVIGVFSVNYAFTAPYYQFNFTAAGYPIIFLSLLLIAVITSASTDNVKQQARRARASERSVRRLYDFSQKLASAHNGEQMIQLTMQYLHEQLECPVLYLKQADDIARDAELICGEIGGFVSTSIEHAAVCDCFAQVCDTGAGTTHAPFAQFRYIPLTCGDNMFGCVGLLLRDRKVSDETFEHVRAILAQTGISLERQKFAEERNRAAMAADREKLRNNLLRTISHDLRTPLTGIIGASAAIEENGDQIGRVETQKLASDIHEDAEWLLRMVENLLSVTRVSQTTELKKSEEPAEEVIAEAVLRCKKRFPDAQIRVQLPEEMLFIPMDVTLIVQVLINLIENAIHYAGTPIDISLRRNGASAEFIVRDFGPGIQGDTKDTLFEAAQVQSDSKRGLGIGLTLCRSIIAAHGGTISQKNHPDGGAQFVFTLPMEEEA
ncbi:MAG: DUF4118 domain-containing protein [Eubacteriales bacterium]|nr:DUF4118 domain-containing protein [Eubacteriales bacterium]